ncbi:MAG: hypothetical protein RL120_05245 [Gammaproteobacteria bacterium]
MNPVDLIQAVLLMGLPLGGLSWLIFTWLYHSGEIDRSADRKTVSARVKEMKASYKSSRAKRRSNPILAKWMWFGSGFYGLAGLWTFLAIEVSQFFDFLFNYPGTDYLLRDGFFSFVIDVLVNQLLNVVMAFIWFTWWPADSFLIWLVVAYMGYWAGVEAARRQQDNAVVRWIGSMAQHSVVQRVVSSLQRDVPVEESGEQQ